MYNLKDLIKSADETHACINGKWVPARPLNHTCRSIFEKLKDAWAVFTGKADCFKWPEGQ